MDKKLPGVFVNKIDKELTNNKSVFYSQYEGMDRLDKVEEIKDSPLTGSFSSGNIEQKIQDIFRSSNYIYKADVIITTENGQFEKRVVGRHGGNLITMENELIPIQSILDISLKW